ncbi:MAG: DMT family transporter [Alphaproteobacteria bacterium]|nr:DMT family transporter [Alphaproteobacteria bacterium]
MCEKKQTSPGHENLLGILLMLASVAIFTCQDVLTAYLARTYPIPFFMTIRYWFFLLFAIFIAARSKNGLRDTLRSRRPWIQIARAILLVVEIGAFALSLRYLELAELHSLFAASPLIVTALSVLFLKETVGWRRWSAVFFGMSGVTIILRPGFGVFKLEAILGLFVAIIFAIYTIMTRLVSKSDPFLTTYLYTAFFGSLCMTLIVPFFWITPKPIDWLWIGLLCLSGTCGHLCLIKALELAPASKLQPLTYLQLAGVTTLGFVFFGEVPDMITIFGAMVIITSGTYVILREGHLALKKKKEKGDKNSKEQIISQPIIKT